MHVLLMFTASHLSGMASINLHSSSVAFPASSKHSVVPCEPLLKGKGFLRRLGFNFKVGVKVRAVISGEVDLLVHLESGKDPLALKEAIDPIQIGQQLDAIAFETLTEQMSPITRGFYSNINEHDLDRPPKGFSSIPDATEDIRQGKLVIVVDDEDRENEGDLTMAASMVTPKAMAFIVKHGTGIVCVRMKVEDLESLKLPLMVTQRK